MSNTDADLLNQKFVMNWLRAAILQRPAQNMIASETLYTALGAVKERTLLDIEKPTVKTRAAAAERDAYLDIFQRSQKFILLPNVRNSWDAFIQHLDLPQMQQLAGLFEKLGSQIIELWINSSFAEAWNKKSKNNENELDTNDLHVVKTKNCLDQLLKLTNAPNLQASLEMQKQSLNLATEFSKHASTFAEPAQFDELYSNLNTNLVPMISKCIDMMGDASADLEITLLTHAFDEMITAFDACIKGLSESSFYNKENTQEITVQAQRFAKMLKHYYEILVKLMKFLPDQALQQQANTLMKFLPKRYEELCQHINDRDAAALLLPSENFSVVTAALGSGYLAPNRARPETLVDFFTMIHQSLIAASQSINTRDGVKIGLPKQLQELSDNLCSQLNIGYNRHPSSQNVVYHHPNITISFNAPLNLHSAQFLIHAEVNSKGDIISAEFEGKIFPSDIIWGGYTKLFALTSYYSQDHQMEKPANCDDTMLDAMLSEKERGLKNLMIQSKTPICFKWTIPLNPQTFSNYKIDSIMYLQKMIDAFSQSPNQQEKAEDELSRFFADAESLQILKNHPWSLFLVSNLLHKIDKEQRINIVNAAFDGLLQHWTLDNLSAVLTIRRSFLSEMVDRAPVVLELIDHIIDDNDIWKDANHLYNVLDFLLVINPESSRDRKETLTSKLINLNIFTPERLKKLYERVQSMPIEIQSKHPYHREKYEDMHREFTALYGKEPT